jgi:hypothetical protein
VDGVRDGELTGWVLDTEAPDTPVLVTVLAHGRAVATVLAAWLRGDLAKAHGTRGYHGFGVDLTRSVPPSSAVAIEARLPDGRPLGPPLTAAIPAAPPRPHPPLIFMHLPKTAGTAFREAIEDAFRPSERLHIYPDDAFYPKFFSIWQMPLDQRARLGFVTGHLTFGIHQALPGPSKYITLLRDPFERMRSYYLHLARQAPESLVVGGRLRTLSELLEEPHDMSFDNFMVRSFAAIGPRVCPLGTLGQAHLDLALANLRSHFAFVGFQDHADSSYRRMREMFGWSSRPALHLANVGRAADTLTDEAEARETAERREQWDIRLYEEARRMFPPD